MSLLVLQKMEGETENAGRNLGVTLRYCLLNPLIGGNISPFLQKVRQSSCYWICTEFESSFQVVLLEIWKVV